MKKNCEAVITQLSAIRSGLDHSIGVNVSENLVECVQNAVGEPSNMNESIHEAVKLLVKSRSYQAFYFQHNNTPTSIGK